MSQFQEMEQTVYNSLFTLIKDTSVLRDYAAAALLIVQVRAAGRQERGERKGRDGATRRDAHAAGLHAGTHRPASPAFLRPRRLPATPQESFQAGYAAFEPSLPQYSSSALPAGGGYGAPQLGVGSMGGGLPMGEANKYDPKGADKYGDQAAGKVGGRVACVCAALGGAAGGDPGSGGRAPPPWRLFASAR
jgi:hypothetical protein